MKKVNQYIKVLLSSAAVVFALSSSFAQTSKDTVKAGRANDPMNVNPGKANDGMAVKPADPHDGMSVMSDTSFLAKNILDNRHEIELAKLGQAKGTSAAVKKAAAMMITDHTTILNDLVKLAARKQGSSTTDRHGMDMPSFNLAQGEAFDRAWASEMLTMHEAKITELESFLSLTKDTALKAAVLRAIPKIKAHRDLLSAIPGAKEKGKTQTI